MKCDDCEQEKHDAIARALTDVELAHAGKPKGEIRTLCTECTAKYRGREWMAEK